MKVAVNVLNFGPDASPEGLFGWARFLEDIGYHAAMISDHIAVTPDVAEQYPAPFYDPFTTLAWFAGMTERIELGTTVTVLPYRNPLHTARIGANIDRFSNGRLILGVGVGWARQEFNALEVPFEKRGAITDEYLSVITKLWSQDTVSIEGEFVSFEAVDGAPRPVRTPHPPIWIGGNSKAAIRRSVQYGTAWHPIHPRIPWLRAHGLPALRDMAESRMVPTPGFAPRIRLRHTDDPLGEEERLPGEGTLDQIRGDLHALAELGAEYLVLDTYQGEPDTLVKPELDWRLLETVATDVLDLPAESVR